MELAGIVLAVTGINLFGFYVYAKDNTIKDIKRVIDACRSCESFDDHSESKMLSWIEGSEGDLHRKDLFSLMRIKREMWRYFNIHLKMDLGEPIMKQKVNTTPTNLNFKKLIAREGLIIIAVILSLSVLVFVHSKIPSLAEYQNNDLVKMGVFVEGRDLIKEHAPKALTDNVMSLNEDQIKKLARNVLCDRKKLNIWQDVPSGTEDLAQKDLEKLPDDELAWLGHVSIEKLNLLPQDKKTFIDIRALIQLMINLLLALYPTYWLIRFILWAIKTLRALDK